MNTRIDSDEEILSAVHARMDAAEELLPVTAPAWRAANEPARRRTPDSQAAEPARRRLLDWRVRLALAPIAFMALLVIAVIGVGPGKSQCEACAGDTGVYIELTYRLSVEGATPNAAQLDAAEAELTKRLGGWTGLTGWRLNVAAPDIIVIRIPVYANNGDLRDALVARDGLPGELELVTVRVLPTAAP